MKEHILCGIYCFVLRAFVNAVVDIRVFKRLAERPSAYQEGLCSTEFVVSLGIFNWCNGLSYRNIGLHMRTVNVLNL
jgi:hypothetical protein